MSSASVLSLIEPILTKVAELDPATRSEDAAAEAFLAELRAAFPADGEACRTLGEAITAGVADGSLCNRGDENARFCRVAKAGPDTHGFSVDIVSLQGPALAHTHPAGEVTLGFAATAGDADARFDGHPPGWVFMKPGSSHTPTVTGGRMFLIYFLPNGAVQWHPTT